MKWICGVIFSILIITAGVLCAIDPETYNFVGILIRTVLNMGDELSGWVSFLAFLAIAAFVIYSVGLVSAMHEELSPAILSYIVCGIVGLGIAGVESLNTVFGTNIIITPTMAMWCNLVPMICLLLTILLLLFFSDMEWWELIVIAIGSLASLLAGIIICTVIIFSITVIALVLGIGALLVIVIGALSSGGR